MNIYLISQTKNNGYDTFDSAVVIAESEDEAKKIHPSGNAIKIVPLTGQFDQYGTWTSQENIFVQLIGKASSKMKAGDVVCSSFHAG